VVRLCGACCGLIVFSALIVSGLAIGNSVNTIILRAVGGLFGGLFLGLTLGFLATVVIKENTSPTGSTHPTGQENT
jgi:hypothetical protein